MGQVFRQVFFVLFLIGASIGYSYFGPPKYTRYLTNNAVFRMHIAPNLDRMFLSIDGGHDSRTVAYLASATGDLSVRPSTELVFLPAREGQRLYGGTIVTAGERSSAKITLSDDSELLLSENSTVFLDFQQGGVDDGVVQLKVLQGTVSAERKDDSSKLKVKLVSPRGRVARVDRKKLVVVAPTERVDPRKENRVLLTSDAARPRAEFVGLAEEAPEIKEIERALLEGRALNVVQRKDIFEKMDPELEAELNRPVKTAALIAPPAEEKKEVPAVVVAPPPPPPPAPPTPPVPAPTAAEVVKPKARNAALSVKKNRLPAVAEKIAPPPPLAPPSPPPPPEALKPVAPKTKGTVKNFDAPPDQNELSGAMYASKQGDKSTAKRLVASALTRSEYGTNAFNDATRFAVDELMESYIEAGDCEQAKNTMLNVARAYPDNAEAKTWSKKWRENYKGKCQ